MSDIFELIEENTKECEDSNLEYEYNNSDIDEYPKNFFFPKSALGMKKIVKLEKLQTMKNMSYKDNEINNENTGKISEKTTKKDKEIISQAKEIYNKIAEKKKVYIQGIPIELGPRGTHRQSLIAASIYYAFKNKGDTT